MRLNCKVKKSVNPPPFLHQAPLFLGLSPFLAKNFVPLPQVTQFFEVPTPLPLNKRGGEGPTM